MPMTSIALRPGVNSEKTLTANEAGVSQSQALRYKDGLLQTIGGWDSILVISPSTVRDLHAWQDTDNVDWLSAAATNNLTVAASTTNSDVIPQTRTSDFNPASINVSSGSTVVTINDPNSGPSVYNVVFFNTPVSVGSVLLNGPYQITSVLSTGSYTINSSVANTVTGAGGSSSLPHFATTNGSPIVVVDLPNNGFQSIVGLQQSFRVPTVVDGLTIFGPYNITTVIDSTSFAITATSQANAADTATMNSTLVQANYYVTLGPASSGSGFGALGFGGGGYGSGVSFITEPGTPITALDWSQDNWGEILLACPKDGAIYSWSPHSGFQNAQVIEQAPFFNGGIFISMPQQILVAWKSTQASGTQGNLIVRWSDSGDYTNWEETNQTDAGSFTIPTGSVIIGGLQAPNFGVIWTDVDVWIMQFVSGDVIFNFTRVGSGCGLIGQHAAGVISNEVYWCGISNFFKLGGRGVEVINCSVWDTIFQNLNSDQVSKIRCAPNSAFNEIAWFYPSINATENDSYVKYNILENEWDHGMMARTAWTDVSIIGMPVGADPGGVLWQHETGQSMPGVPVTSFRTGWWSISDGNDLVFIDWLIPDFKWGIYSGNNDAEVNVTLYVQDYQGDTPRAYGPFTVTQQTQYLSPRLRGRLMSMLIVSNNDVFWRLGRVRFRYAPSGRR